jgi:hypothetical protein
VLDRIRGGDWSDETQQGLAGAVNQYTEDFGYDLDAEGLPLTDEERLREGRTSMGGDGLPTGGGTPVADPDRPAAVPAVG